MCARPCSGVGGEGTEVQRSAQRAALLRLAACPALQSTLGMNSACLLPALYCWVRDRSRFVPELYQSGTLRFLAPGSVIRRYHTPLAASWRRRGCCRKRRCATRATSRAMRRSRSPRRCRALRSRAPLRRGPTPSWCACAAQAPRRCSRARSCQREDSRVAQRRAPTRGRCTSNRTGVRAAGRRPRHPPQGGRRRARHGRSPAGGGAVPVGRRDRSAAGPPAGGPGPCCMAHRMRARKGLGREHTTLWAGYRRGPPHQPSPPRNHRTRTRACARPRPARWEPSPAASWGRATRCARALCRSCWRQRVRRCGRPHQREQEKGCHQLARPQAAAGIAAEQAAPAAAAVATVPAAAKQQRWAAALPMSAARR